MTNTISVCIPEDTRERAGKLRINISEVCRKALRDEVEKVEKEKEALDAFRRQTSRTQAVSTPVKEVTDNG